MASILVDGDHGLNVIRVNAAWLQAVRTILAKRAGGFCAATVYHHLSGRGDLQLQQGRVGLQGGGVFLTESGIDIVAENPTTIAIAHSNAK